MEGRTELVIADREGKVPFKPECFGWPYHHCHDVCIPDVPCEEGVLGAPCGMTATLYGPIEPGCKHSETARHPSPVGHLARAPEYCGYGYLVYDTSNLSPARTDDRW